MVREVRQKRSASMKKTKYMHKSKVGEGGVSWHQVVTWCRGWSGKI